MRLAALMLLAAMAGGCAAYMSARVTSFHQLSQDDPLAGKVFAIEPTVEQKDSLEYRAYADLIRQALIRLGLVDGGTGEAALAVTIRYSIDNGQPVSYSYPAYGYAHYGPVWGWTPYRNPAGGISYTWAAAYPLSYGVIGANYGTSVIYRRELRVVIADRRQAAAASDKDKKSARLYEGTAVSEGESASLAPVMPEMVRALFYEFPGRSGSSRIVHVRVDRADQAVEAPPARAARVEPGQSTRSQ